jgi:SAM-dependent methyltransferase
MHESCLDKVRIFIDEYLGEYKDKDLSVLDVGSMTAIDSHKSHRPLIADTHWKYTGLDIEPGPNVDVVPGDPYDWMEIPDNNFDVVLCSQVFEHIEFIWISILEISRVLKPNGLACIIAPSAGTVHRHPYDCWRYYPDGLQALAKYADLRVLESDIQKNPVYKKGNIWKDASIIVQKPASDDKGHSERHVKNILAKMTLKKNITRSDIESIDFSYQPDGESIIRKMEGHAAISGLEKELLISQGAMRVKARIIIGHLREILRCIRKPL